MKINWKNPFKKENRNVKDNEEVQIKEELDEYYNIEPIDKTNATYRLIIGQRSNGKTYSACKHIIENYITKGERGAYIRRYDEDITPKNIQSLFDPHLDFIKTMTNEEYNCISYRAKEFHLCYMDDEGKILYKDPEAFCVTASINTAEHTKGQDRGVINTIIFDEFMTREGYLNNEFVKYCNILSSLIRTRDTCIIYMLANTVNRYCPYFKEMGLKDVENMPQGEIYLYHYGNADLTVAVEYCSPVRATEKVASKFFAFDNPQLEMITNGAWELMMYPRAPYKIFEEDIFRRFYVEFGGQLLCCEIIKRKKDLFIFVHLQTKDVDITDHDVLYTDEFTSSMLHCRFLKDCPTELHKLIKNLILKKSICFSTNEVGELFRNWLIETQNIKLF